MRQIGLDAEAVFSHPDIKVWRFIPERENCTLDATLNGKPIRLHIKRYRATSRSPTPADEESHGIQSLLLQEIPTAPLVGWGQLADGRSFVITEDLAGFCAADKAIPSSISFEDLLEPTAELTAKLHHGYPEKDRHILQALNCAMIIAYARPFSGNRGSVRSRYVHQSYHQPTYRTRISYCP